MTIYKKGKCNKWQPDAINEVRKQAADGLTFREIAIYMGIETDAVRHIAKRNKINVMHAARGGIVENTNDLRVIGKKCVYKWTQEDRKSIADGYHKNLRKHSGYAGRDADVKPLPPTRAFLAMATMMQSRSVNIKACEEARVSY